MFGKKSKATEDFIAATGPTMAVELPVQVYDQLRFLGTLTGRRIEEVLEAAAQEYITPDRTELMQRARALGNAMGRAPK
jgi:hypothetical protein